MPMKSTGEQLSEQRRKRNNIPHWGYFRSYDRKIKMQMMYDLSEMCKRQIPHEDILKYFDEKYRGELESGGKYLNNVKEYAKQREKEVRKDVEKRRAKRRKSRSNSK